MQLSVIEPKQMLVPMLKTKPLDLADEILSKISSLPEFEQAELLALAAPKLQGDRLKEAFNMVLLLENSLSKGLALIEFLPYLEEKALDDATVAILSFIESSIEKEDKILLIESLVKQLSQLERDIVKWFRYIINTSEKLAVIVKNNFEIQEQISLEAKFFSLVYEHHSGKDQSLYSTEIERLSKEAQAIESLTERAIALITLLNQFPLETEDKAKLSSMALSALNQLAIADTEIELKYKIKALGFLQYFYVEENRIFGERIYKEIFQNTQLKPVEKLELLNSFATYYSYDYKETHLPDGRLNLCAMRDMASIIEVLCKDKGKEGREYIEVVEFLVSRIFFNACWSYEAIRLIDNIKSPIARIDSSLLILPELTDFKLKEKFAVKTLKLLSLIIDEQEQIILTTRLLKYLSKTTKQRFVFSLVEKIGSISDEAAQAELLVDLVPYLTPKLRKKAFEMALSIGNYFDTVWACIAFAPYLTQEMRERVIKDGFNALNKPAYSITFTQKALILKQLINSGLGSANKG